MKLLYSIGVLIGGTIGGWLGAAMSHGNWLSGWSILFSAIGSFAGIWLGYKANQYIG